MKDRSRQDMKKRRSWKWICLLLFLAVLGTATPVTVRSFTEVSAAVKTNGLVKKGSNYYFYSAGKKVTGWKTVGGRWYYFSSAKNGAALKGLQIIDGKCYCFTTTGKRYTEGWHKIQGCYYYMNKDGSAKTGWWTDSKGKKYYFKRSKSVMGRAAVGTYTMGNYRRTFNSRGILVKSEKLNSGSKNQLQKSTGTRTIRNYLLEALRPIGTQYKQIGGWPGTNSTTIPSTMDCSGFVGWASYQMMRNSLPSGVISCSAKSYSIPELYKAWGWGSVRSHSQLAKNHYMGQFHAGDIVRVKHDNGTTGHVWIVVGQCGDGSYVLVHCSGSEVMGCTQLAGTPTPDGKVGEAYQLAKSYMQKYHQKTLQKYPWIIQSTSSMPYGTLCTDLYNYMTSKQVVSFRWSEKTLTDPEKLAGKSADQILKSLYGEG